SGSSKLTARATTARVRMAAPPCARPLAPEGRGGNAGCRRSRRVREMMRPVGCVTPNTGATRPAETAPLDGPPELLIRLAPRDGDRRPRAQVTRGFVDLEQLPPDDVRLDRHGVPVRAWRDTCAGSFADARCRDSGGRSWSRRPRAPSDGGTRCRCPWTRPDAQAAEGPPRDR